MEVVIFCGILLGPLAHLPGLVDDVLILYFHKDLPPRSVWWCELIMVAARTSEVVIGSGFVALLLRLRRRKGAALLRVLAHPYVLHLLYYAFFDIDIFLGVG